jgi:hypothetical protein
MITRSIAEDIAHVLGVVNDMGRNITTTNEVVSLLTMKVELESFDGSIGKVEWSDSEEEFVFIPTK